MSLILNVACAPAVKLQNPAAAGSSSFSSNSKLPISISPAAPIVNDTGSIPLFANGGTPPYTFNVITPEAGYFSGNLFTAADRTGQVIASVTDAKGLQMFFTINIMGTSAALPSL